MIDTGNPYYAPEEFTYNQDPLELPTIEAEIEPLDTNEILESGAEFSIRPRGERRAEADRRHGVAKAAARRSGREGTAERPKAARRGGALAWRLLFL